MNQPETDSLSTEESSFSKRENQESSGWNELTHMPYTPSSVSKNEKYHLRMNPIHMNFSRTAPSPNASQSSPSNIHIIIRHRNRHFNSSSTLYSSKWFLIIINLCRNDNINIMARWWFSGCFQRGVAFLPFICLSSDFPFILSWWAAVCVFTFNLYLTFKYGRNVMTEMAADSTVGMGMRKIKMPPE